MELNLMKLISGDLYLQSMEPSKSTSQAKHLDALCPGRDQGH